MCDCDKITCFDCRVAEIDPGSPDVFYLPNGDPGYPGDPAYAMCMDPLASQMADEFEEILTKMERAKLDAVWINTSELKNCKPGEETRLPYEIKRRIELSLRHWGDFAPFCPMFQKRDVIRLDRTSLKRRVFCYITDVGERYLEGRMKEPASNEVSPS